VQLERLDPPGQPASVAQIVDAFGLWGRASKPSPRPRVLLNMVATADGRASLAGRSGPLSGPADRALFHGLRAAVDAILVGAGTVRAERYGRIIADAAQRQLRVERGFSAEPLACVVSTRMDLDAGIPLLAEPEARVLIVTPSSISLPPVTAHVDYVRAPRDGTLDLAVALRELAERFAVQTVLCEGGPYLAYQLIAEGLVSELFLTLTPLLAGGEPTDGQSAEGEALRILAGGELQPPVELELRSVLRGGSQLFLRYGVGT